MRKIIKVSSMGYTVSVSVDELISQLVDQLNQEEVELFVNKIRQSVQVEEIKDKVPEW